jgi:hypothetical protein
MEFIQWQTAGPDKAGLSSRDVRGSKNTTHHALFRLDPLDAELMDKDVLMNFRNDEARLAAEEGGRISKGLPNIRVDEDDLEVYKEKCLETFKKILL